MNVIKYLKLFHSRISFIDFSGLQRRGMGSAFLKLCRRYSGTLTLTASTLLGYCTTVHRYPIFSTRYSVMCKVFTGYCGTSEVEHGLCACTVDNPLAKARGLSLRTGAQTIRTGAQTMLYLSLGNLYLFIQMIPGISDVI